MQNRPQATKTHSADQTSSHLANERTFLAWIRTALALLGFGFVLARVGLFLRQLILSAPAAESAVPRMRHVHEFVITGTVFLGLGTLISAWAAWHYLRTRRAIEDNRFEAAGLAIVIVALLSVVGGLVIMGLVISGGVGQN
jgi:putative membrane protein